jgi:hypothetical protein
MASDDAPWWGHGPTRLIVLLAVLAGVAALGAHKWLNAKTSRAAAACYPAAAHPPARWSAAKVDRAVSAAGLRSLVGDGSPDIEGSQDPMAAWSDQYPSDASPHDPFLVPALAGYEIRWWSRENIHEGADLFVFPSARDAARYVRQATLPRCRPGGGIFHPIAEPRGAASVIWDNPLGYLQADVLFSRGNRAYRISVVPNGPANRLPSSVNASRLLEAPQQIACQLSAAMCHAGT